MNNIVKLYGNLNHLIGDNLQNCFWGSVALIGDWLNTCIAMKFFKRNPARRLLKLSSWLGLSNSGDIRCCYSVTGISTGALSGTFTRTTSIEQFAINALIAPMAANVGTASTPTKPTVNGNSIMI
jgi:hypothetical protein